MDERRKDEEGKQASNVIDLSTAIARRREPQPSDEELAEYRRIRPALLKMLDEWPKLLREHRAVTSNCRLAQMLIAQDD